MRLVGFLSCLLLPGLLQAQDACTYRKCALRIEGSKILRGIDDTVVARVVFLAPTLPLFAERSDSAAAQYQQFRRAQSQSFWLTLTGGVLMLSGYVFTQADEDRFGALGLALALPGTGLMLTGAFRGSAARRNLSKAVWWYNGTLPPDSL